MERISDDDLENALTEISEEETVSESEDHITENECSSSESESEERPMQQVNNTLLSKDKSIEWKRVPSTQQGRKASCNVISNTPGPTRYATSRIHDEYTSFLLYFPPPLEKIILDNTNIEGKRIYEDNWHGVDSIEMHAYFGLLLLAGVYKSHNESTESLWNADTGRNIFRATMSLQRFKIISRAIRFDNRETRAGRRERDKLAAIRELWDKWIEILPKLYNPGEFVTVDEQLVAFRGKCPFRQYMPSKPAKYGIKFWVLCDNATSYAWNIQIYTGKLPGEPPEKKQGLRVVLDLSYGLKGHNLTCDNFFTSYELGLMLLKRNMTMTGTIRKTKPLFHLSSYKLRNYQSFTPLLLLQMIQHSYICS